MPGRVKFATSPAPRPPLAALVANPTPPGQITRERVPSIGVRQPRDSVLSPIWLRRATGNQLLTDRPAAGPLRRARARYTQTAPVARSIPAADLDLQPLSVRLSVKVVESSEIVVASFGK